MKYAIAQTSGKQFLVKPGQWYDIDFIKDGKIGKKGWSKENRGKKWKKKEIFGT